MNRKMKYNLVWLALLVAGTVWILARRHSPVPYQKDEGIIFGTIYNVTYRHDKNLKADIEAELKRFDASLSPFNEKSLISRVNRNEPVQADTLFANVFRRSQQISQETDGAFDITVAPLVNAWGFGFKEGAFPDSCMVDSLLQFTGYRKVRLTADNRIEKDDPRLMLTCSAVAKGYAVDVVAGLLERHGIRDFLVDIGGEVVVRGKNPQEQPWRIGINKPVDDSLAIGGELQTVLHITDAAMATSGNYRNFYFHNGKKYAHTIDPRTGMPVQHEILSATVIARDCMSADAYATAFMVMGLQKAIAFAEAHPEIDAYFIYNDAEGVTRVYRTEGMKRYLSSLDAGGSLRPLEKPCLKVATSTCLRVVTSTCLRVTTSSCDGSPQALVKDRHKHLRGLLDIQDPLHA